MTTARAELEESYWVRESVKLVGGGMEGVVAVLAWMVYPPIYDCSRRLKDRVLGSLVFLVLIAQLW